MPINIPPPSSPSSSGKASEQVIEQIRNACQDITKAVQDKIKELFDALQRWIDDLIPFPGIAELINRFLDTLESFVSKLNDALKAICQTFAEHVIPWILAPLIFRETAAEWETVASSAVNVSNRINNTSTEASPDHSHSWSGVGAEAYATTTSKQGACAEGIRVAIDQVPGLLKNCAQGVENEAIAISAVVTACVASIVTIVIGAATGPGEAAAIVIAIIEIIAGIIAAIIGIVQAVIALAHDAENKVEEIRKTTNNLASLASNGRQYWHEPGTEVNGSGTAPGTTGWDDGF